jgi:GT2 family glycosyltransferase
MTVRKPSVLISILNWNKSEDTIRCVHALQSTLESPDVDARVLLIDNGSAVENVDALRVLERLPSIEIHREPRNLGFAGGHNIAIERAIAEGADFIWLLNSDAEVDGDTLARLVDSMAEQPRCGALSPMIVAAHDAAAIDFCGAVHDWSRLRSIRTSSLEESRELQRSRPMDMWVTGTAVLFRVQALKEIGPLDARYFAYYEDDDIGARLSHAGWASRVDFDTVIRHDCLDGLLRNRPPYYFYLMSRNHLMFWHAHTPAVHRRFLRLRLLKHALFEANKLSQDGLDAKSDAAMLGVHDFLRGAHGAPRLDRRLPWTAATARALSKMLHARALAQRRKMLSAQIAGAMGA